MFVTAIERVNQFTRPIKFVTRLYGQKNQGLMPGAATLFFVNEDGWAITCNHVAEQILQENTLHQRYLQFAAERRRISNEPNFAAQLQRLEAQFGYVSGSVIGVSAGFVDCMSQLENVHIIPHPRHDLALLKLTGKNQKYRTSAVFLADGQPIKPGKTLCRLGYPFAEFNNFRINPDLDQIEWINDPAAALQPFPIDGIVTRHLYDNGQASAIEISTPGLRGQSGGPLFDTEGVIYGMQFATRHLHLGFDQINQEVWVGNQPTNVSNHPFLHVGMCINADIIKAFLRENNVKFHQNKS
jgi:hypothetical protein